MCLYDTLKINENNLNVKQSLRLCQAKSLQGCYKYKVQVTIPQHRLKQGYFDWYHYNFWNFENYHYYSSILRWAITILQHSEIYHYIRSGRPWAQLQMYMTSSYFWMDKTTPPPSSLYVTDVWTPLIITFLLPCLLPLTPCASCAVRRCQPGPTRQREQPFFPAAPHRADAVFAVDSPLCASLGSPPPI